MFDSAESEQPLSEADYREQSAALRQALLAAQYRLLENRSAAVVVIVAGVDGAGKGEIINLFNEWMDPRHIQTHGFGGKTIESQQFPSLWPFWQVMPARGKICLLAGSWYTTPIVDYANKLISKTTWQDALDEVQHLEEMLHHERVIVIKLWFHLSQKAQKKRLIDLEKNPKTRWRVTETDWQRYRHYRRFRTVSEHSVSATHTATTPWHIIDGSCPRYRAILAGNALLSALTATHSTTAQHTAISSLSKTPLSPHPLAALDYTQKMERADYEHQLELWQGRLNLLTRDPRFSKKSLVVVFEGQDAAGKGGAIRCLTAALDARQYQVIPISAPTEEERHHPWLWRFWRRLPKYGHITLFDRSWYGRVLVEVIERFITPADQQRAYTEINDFENQLLKNGTLVIKFWLAITRDEQLKRFREREQVAFQNHKLTPEDWRNRRQWKAYDAAIAEMVQHTHTPACPWVLIPSNDVEHARIEVLKTLCMRLEAHLNRR